MTNVDHENVDNVMILNMGKELETAAPSYPEEGLRIGPVWERILHVLASGQWQRWSDVVAAATPDSGLKIKTVFNLLHHGVSRGLLERRGTYSSNKQRDTRAVRKVKS